MKKHKYFGWFNWKNPDEIDSKALTHEDADISLHLKINIRDYAQLVEELGRNGLYITIEKSEKI